MDNVPTFLRDLSPKLTSLGFAGLLSVFLLPPALYWIWFASITATPLVPKGYTKLNRSSRSNIDDEGDAKYSISKSTGSEKWKVKALFIHPIKSCAAVELDRAALDRAGFLWDRKFAVAELMAPPVKKTAEDKGRRVWTFRSLRQPGYEKLAKVKPEIWLRDAQIEPANQNAEADGVLVVRYPYVPSGRLAWLSRILLKANLVSNEVAFRVPLVPPQDHRYPSEDVTIWRDSPSWLNYGIHVPSSFQTFLGAKNPVTLFRVDPQRYREVFRNAPRKAQLGYQPVVGFADAYPVHLLNLASVRDVADRVRDAIPNFTARRFRSNILVTGGGKYDEDEWKRVEIGGHVLHCACHTIRCRLPNVDPDTAMRHPVEPDKTLRSFRCIDAGDPLGAALGLQLVPAQKQVFELKVGDEVRVLERGEHLYIKQ